MSWPAHHRMCRHCGGVSRCNANYGNGSPSRSLDNCDFCKAPLTAADDYDTYNIPDDHLASVARFEALDPKNAGELTMVVGANDYDNLAKQLGITQVSLKASRELLKRIAPTFDEAAERAAFQNWFSENYPKSNLERNPAERLRKMIARLSWLACARHKAGVL